MRDRGGSEVRVLSASPDETRALGARLGGLVVAGTVVALDGDLGAGKTVLVKGVASGLGVPERAVRSPTFTLVDHHEEGRVPLVHVDAYRLSGAEAFRDLGLDAVLRPDACVCVEWAARVADALPADRLHVVMEHAGPSERAVAIRALGRRAAAVLERLREGLGALPAAPAGPAPATPSQPRPGS